LRRVRAGLLVLPGPDARLSLTCVTNLADACLAATAWPAGAYNIADARPYWRDAAVRAVLAVHGRRARVVHAPLTLASSVARAAEAVARLAGSAEPYLSRYAVEQLGRGLVLDIGKAAAQGWWPRRALHDYVAAGIRTRGPAPPARSAPG
jgi:nucleoside-diphosphate-sugar epimerase